ncbi:hypothetical protein ABKN59_004339 [Abortiporus biennis]
MVSKSSFFFFFSSSSSSYDDDDIRLLPVDTVKVTDSNFDLLTFSLDVVCKNNEEESLHHSSDDERSRRHTKYSQSGLSYNG